jgi:hypothetical protein
VAVAAVTPPGAITVDLLKKRNTTESFSLASQRIVRQTNDGRSSLGLGGLRKIPF